MTKCRSKSKSKRGAAARVVTGRMTGVTTYVQSRVPVFAPTRRPRAVAKFRVETPWGRVTITGRLGQRHRDVLDAIPLATEWEGRTPDGALHRLIDPHKLRKAIAPPRGRDRRVSRQRLDEWLRDMRAAEVAIETKSGGVYEGIFHRVVTRREEAAASQFRELHGRGFAIGERHLWGVTYSPSWVRLMDEDLILRYDLGAIVALEHGVSQAVARLLLTHDPGRFQPTGLDTVLTQVGVPEKGQARRDARRWVLDDAARLRGLGIIVHNDRTVELAG